MTEQPLFSTVKVFPRFQRTGEHIIGSVVMSDRQHTCRLLWNTRHILMCEIPTVSCRYSPIGFFATIRLSSVNNTSHSCNSREVFKIWDALSTAKSPDCQRIFYPRARSLRDAIKYFFISCSLTRRCRPPIIFPLFISFSAVCLISFFFLFFF